MKVTAEVKALAGRVWAELDDWARGRREAYSRNDLCVGLRCGDRDLRKAVAYLRSIGRPVGCETKSPGGYYVITDAADLRRVRRQFRSRLVAAAVALAGLDKGSVGQQVLDLLGDNDEGGADHE